MKDHGKVPVSNISTQLVSHNRDLQVQCGNNYRPHPKDGEGNVFSLSTTGEGYPSPRFFDWFLVPGPFLGEGYPSPGRGYPVPVIDEGYPSLSHGWMVPQDRGTTTPGQDGVSQARPGWGTPSQDSGMSPRTEQQGEHLLRWGGGEVCLLRSHRRDFLVHTCVWNQATF